MWVGLFGIGGGEAMTTADKVAESNRIEGITRPPTQAEIDEHERFMGLEKVTTKELLYFLRTYQPNAKLRSEIGMDVTVGGYRPPAGGEDVSMALWVLLVRVYYGEITPWNAHIEYEHLHPFMDGNGRSGRALWYWMMARDGNKLSDLGFLHGFYYQTLEGGTR